MYYGYYMLPDGTFCLAPPPPGIEATSYYNTVPSAVTATPASSGALPNAETASTSTPTPAESIVVAPAATASAQVTSSAAPAAPAVAESR